MENDSLQIVEFNGRKIIFKKQTYEETTTSSMKNREFYAAPVWQGPFYATNPTMTKIKSKEKVIINQANVPEIVILTGVYICDVYCFTHEIDFPPHIAVAGVLTPTNPAYSNYSTQEKGVIWNLSTGNNNTLRLNIKYYTLYVIHNAVGQPINKVIPFDGITLAVPYLTLSF